MRGFGVGKTVLAIAALAALGQRTLICVHKQFRAEQWRERLTTFLGVSPEDVGLVQGPTKRYARITVAMIQSVTSAGFADDDDALRQFGLVVVDEVHHLPARTFAQLLPKLSSRHVLGLQKEPLFGEPPKFFYKKKNGKKKIIFKKESRENNMTSP